MAKIHVTAKRDFLESLTVAKPVSALAEIIWNGFDAKAKKVEVFLGLNEMDGLQAISVRDDGQGIDYSQLESQFGSLGESWKRNAGRQDGRSLHGKNGKGRFKAFGLGERVQWKTTFDRDGAKVSYTITGRAQTLDDFDATQPIACVGTTGTEVTIENLKHSFRSLMDDSSLMEFAKIFAAYLTEYPNIILEYDGNRVDPKSAQIAQSEYHLGDVSLGDGRKTSVAVTIIEWKIQTDRAFYLCDKSGVSLHEIPLTQRIRAPGFNFTAYLKSDLFLDLDKKNQLNIAELHPDVQTISKIAVQKVKEHFRRRILENQSQTVERWKQEQIYPYEEKVALDPVESAKRQMFEILAVNVESYLPSFEDADLKSKKFTFRLLAQAISENPESVQRIIGEVLGLKKAAQDELAELLEKTSLSQIISSAKIVADRLDFLNALEYLLFDKSTKKSLLERDQLHKILEKEAWIFHEEFSLAGSEQRLEDVLAKHVGLLGKRTDDDVPVELDGKGGRVDLMLHRAIQPRHGEFDYLIVELKRPSKRIDSDVISQIKKYAATVASDERFRDVPARWTFLAVSNDFDEFATRDANQRNVPRGRVYDDASMNVTVWVRTWAEVINDARAKLQFVNEHLSYEADAESATSYLKRAHAKFIPNASDSQDDVDE